jgi:uncharacterized Zn finger protein
MTPMCPNCKGTTFVEAEVVVSDHPCGVLQCESCGAVLGVIDFVLRDKVAEVQKALHHRL